MLHYIPSELNLWVNNIDVGRTDKQYLPQQIEEEGNDYRSASGEYIEQFYELTEYLDT